MVQKKLKKTKEQSIISPNQNWLWEINYFKSLIGSINNLDEPIPIEVYVFTSEFEKIASLTSFLIRVLVNYIFEW